MTTAPYCNYTDEQLQIILTSPSALFIERARAYAEVQARKSATQEP